MANITHHLSSAETLVLNVIGSTFCVSMPAEGMECPRPGNRDLKHAAKTVLHCENMFREAACHGKRTMRASLEDTHAIA